MLKSLYGQLVPLITERKPVSVKVPDEVNTTWVRPKLVAEFKFAEWTSKGGNATAGFSRVAHRQASQRCGEGDAAITIVVLAQNSSASWPTAAASFKLLACWQHHRDRFARGTVLQRRSCRAGDITLIPISLADRRIREEPLFQTEFMALLANELAEARQQRCYA